MENKKVFNLGSSEGKLCPFKKARLNLDSAGMQDDIDDGNLAIASNAKITREQFEHCDREQCMAYDSGQDSCGLINKPNISGAKADDRMLISRILICSFILRN